MKCIISRVWFVLSDLSFEFGKSKTCVASYRWFHVGTIFYHWPRWKRCFSKRSSATLSQFSPRLLLLNHPQCTPCGKSHPLWIQCPYWKFLFFQNIFAAFATQTLRNTLLLSDGLRREPRRCLSRSARSRLELNPSRWTRSLRAAHLTFCIE